jgi:hypothetical protein
MQVLILNTILKSLFYFILFVSCWLRLGRDKDVQLRKQANGLIAPHTSASDFKVFTSINHVRFAHSWVDKK